MSNENSIPSATLSRLATLYQALLDARSRDVECLNSAQIGALIGIPAAQVRKDLSSLGEGGVPGVGYRVTDLILGIARCLKIDKKRRFALVGAGRLGQALASYTGLAKMNFELVMAFDNDPAKIGKHAGDALIEPVAEMPARLKQEGIKVIVLTVPASAAQATADAAISGGARWVLNFTPAILQVPRNCIVRDVSFTNEFAVLAHYMEEG